MGEPISYHLVREYAVSLPIVTYDEQRLDDMLRYSYSHYSAIWATDLVALRILVDETSAIPILVIVLGDEQWLVECNQRNLTNLMSLFENAYYGSPSLIRSERAYYSALRSAFPRT